MPDQKLTQLPVLAALSADDIFYVVDDPAGAASSRQVATSVFDARYLQTANNLSDLTNAVVARASLGLGTLATVNDAPADGTIYGRQNNAWAAASGILPVADTTAIVKGSVTDTKLLRFEVDGFTAATTRVITPPDADITLAGQDYANVFTAVQKINVNSGVALLVEQDGVKDNVLVVDTTSGLVGINTIPATPLNVLGTNGEFRIADVATDATLKNARYTMNHYSSSEEPFILLLAATNSNSNTLTYGGGSSIANTATQLNFNTASNNTTVTGTTRLRIWFDGGITVGTHTASPGVATVKIDKEDTGTTTVVNPLLIVHNSTNTPAANFGVGMLLQGETSTTASQNMAGFFGAWQTATHATAVADLVAQAYYNNGGTFTASEIWRGRAGAAPLFGVLGATPVVRQAHIADPAGGGTQDAEARTAINAILVVLENFGFTATS